MTNRTAEPSLQHHQSDGPPPGRPGLAANRSIRAASLTAGVGLLLISALAGFGNFIALRGLVTEGNAAQTATDIMASNGLFRLGILSLLLTIALDIVVAWALYHVFRPVNNGPRCWRRGSGSPTQPSSWLGSANSLACFACSVTTTT
jgi:hypothetical protein